jgi:hypothetical protein
MSQKIIFSAILFLCLLIGGFVSAAEFPPEITISPEKYFAGEETIYLQGKAEPNIQFFLFLKDKDGNEVKKWPAQSNSQGDWSFISRDLVKAGQYDLSTGIQNGKEAVFSEKRPVEVFLNGFYFFGLGISFKNLIFILVVIFFFFFAVFWALHLKIRKAKRKMQKEAREARDICGIVFEGLQEKIRKRVELIDSQPGFNLEEKKAFDDLNKFLNAARFSIEKEIADVENLIK